MLYVRNNCASVCYMPKSNTKRNTAIQRVLVFWKKLGYIFTSRLVVVRLRLRRAANRQTFANIFMLSFIILTSIGAGMIYPPAGWVVAGVSCGIFGFLLGLE